jgi:2-succinyl-5-enolpyruvyl-6-hydroxy-3-cyclohexene-1-carboxylate synthase
VHTTLAASAAAELTEAWSGRRGLFVAGRLVGRDGGGSDGESRVEPLLALAARLGWPVLADPRSGCRCEHPSVVAHADALLRDPRVAEWLQPEVIVGVGEPPASKVLNQWLATRSARRYLVEPSGRMLDPDRDVDVVLPAPVRAVHDALLGVGVGVGVGVGAGAHGEGARAGGAPADWLARWRTADDAAAAALDQWLATGSAVTEPGAARALARTAGASAERLVVSSSMPVRDLEWYGPRTGSAEIFANRGANGIDGVVSTAVGVALAGVPTWLLIGDLALLHDANGLLGCRQRPLRLRLVAIDNGGGGIFSFLPQAAALPAATFERFFGTPQAVDVAALLAVHGIPVARAATNEELLAGLGALAASTEPVAALVVSTDRAGNVADHAALNTAMAAAAHAALTAL